jgi:nucleoprotein TPR
LHQTNSKIAILQQQLNEGCNEAETLRSRIKSIEDEKKALEIEFSDAQGRAGSSDGILKSLQQRVDALILEKRQTVELLDKRNQEIRELRSDMENAHNKNLDHRRTIVEMESHLQELRSAKLSAKLKEQSLIQEVEMLKKNNEWLDNELKIKSEEFKKFRTERLSKFSSVQNDLDRVQAEHSALSKSYEALKERFSDTSMKYEQSLAKVRDLQGAQDVAEESFRKEMASQQRLAELWERSAKDAKKRVEEVEELLSAERSKKAGDTAKWRAEAEKEHARAENLQKQLSGVESELQSLYQVDKPAYKAGFTTPQRGRDLGTPTAGAAVFSPSARIISELQKQGGNLVDLYAEFHDTKIRLERERHKNETLRAEMDAILEEMENHAPLILADREEKKRLELELAEMSVELEQSNKQAEEVSAKLKTAEMKAKDSKNENSLLSTQLKDLSRQVQYLLIQNQMLIDSEPALDANEHAALQRLLDGEEVDDQQENSENDTQRLISQRLVLFKDIIELQKQNGDLLKITRELGSRMEREEEELKRKVENIESTAVEEAKSAIHKLQQDVKRLQVNSEALKRERDMFRRMLKNGENLETGTKEPNGQDHEYVSSNHSQLVQISKLTTQPLSRTTSEAE